MDYEAVVITVSDRCAAGEREDLSGPVLQQLLQEAGYRIAAYELVPDEQDQIEAVLRKHSESRKIALIATTGGTGFAPRDITPEATKAVCERMAPGIPEAMRYASSKVTNRAMLSRAEAGIRGLTLIINLPGSPKALKENLEAVLPSLSHGLEMLRGGQADCAAPAKH